MPNPSGVNSFQGFAPEPAYGEATQQQQLQQSAPIPANPALAAPRRAKEKARRQSQQPQAQPAPTGPPPAPSQQFVAGQLYAAVAAIPGASPLVQKLASQMQHG